MLTLAKNSKRPPSEYDGLGADAPELVALNDPQSAAAKTIRTLQSQLMHKFVDQGLRSFAVIGDAPRRGASFLAANLAFAFAQSAYRTVLVDANLVMPRQAELFGLSKDGFGLSDVLGNTAPGMAMGRAVVTLSENLAVLPAGTRQESPHLLQQDMFPEVMTNLPRLFDILVCDGPSADDLDGAIAVASAVDRVIILTRQHKTELERLRKFTDTLKQCNAVVAGVVLSQW